MIEIILAQSGNPTIAVQCNGRKIFVHSKYDPILEAEKLVAGWDCKDAKTILVYGVGCGYHLRLLLKKMDYNQNLIVYEFNQELLDTVTRAGVLQDLCADHRFELRSFQKNWQLLKQFANDLNTIDQREGRFFIHPPSSKVIPENLVQVKELLEEYRLQVNSQISQKQLLHDNINKVWNTLHKYPNVGKAKGSFSGVPAIIISAGPSLNESLPWLQKIGDRALTLCVGTALNAVLQNGIRPNFAVAIEGNVAVLQQFSNVPKDIPLIAYPSANAELTLGYSGPVIWAFPEGFEDLRNEAIKYDIPTVESGGSVATAALSIASLFGCNPIVFVGQDLAFIGEESHAKGTIHKEVSLPNRGPYWHITEAVGGGSIQTSRSWNVFRKLIESFIVKHPKQQFYNTSRGARIHGAHETTLEQLLLNGVFSKIFDIDEVVRRTF